MKQDICNFKCTSVDCTAEDTAVRDQIIISLKDDDIHQEALKRSWDLETIRWEGMEMESRARGGAEINEEGMYKMGAYSFKSLKNRQNSKCYKSKPTGHFGNLKAQQKSKR